ncbi:hypothetical protein [Streptomyces sp. NPDC095613]|uniref:hypothetical protein n=1 Tax=Streptomyces sp. NPDC095613 TaxID=3155540 RepID=UPI0033277FB6
MSDTIAVALVTALSTLFGVWFTGRVALRTTARQVEAQERQRRRDHEEQRKVRKREMRREVYVQFLNVAAALESALIQTWDQPLPQDCESVFKEHRARLMRLREIFHVLDMEGPCSVTEAARDVRIAAQRQVDQLEAVVRDARDQGTTKSLGIFASGVWMKCLKTSEDVRDEFLKRARTALN